MVVRSTVALLALTAVLLTAPAGAKAPDKIPVNISIRLDTTPRAVAPRGTFVYKGKLRSEKRACENNRVVTLWKVPEGTDIKENVGSQETPGTGKYAIESLANNDGEYYTTTPEVTLPGSGKVCKRGRSKSLIRDVQP